MHNGTIKSIVFDRGFGFIAEPGQPDIFFHCKDLDGLPFDDQLVGRRVTFTIKTTEKGPRASSVHAAD